MHFCPETLLLPDDPDAAFPADRLRQGVWLIEDGLDLPADHDPQALLQMAGSEIHAAISLRTPSLLRANLAQVLAQWLERLGGPLAPAGILALHEVVLNAAIHGNLEVASGPLSNWSNLIARDKLIESALQDPRLAARAVTVAMGWGRDGVRRAAVADQGAGYVAAEAERAWPHVGRRAAGRGLLLARAGATVSVDHGGSRTRLEFGAMDAADQPA